MKFKFMMPKVLEPASEPLGVSLFVSSESQMINTTIEQAEAKVTNTLSVSSENGIMIKNSEESFKRNVLHGSFICDVPYSYVNAK